MFYKQSLWTMCKHQLCTGCMSLIPLPANGFQFGEHTTGPQKTLEVKMVQASLVTPLEGSRKTSDTAG